MRKIPAFAAALLVAGALPFGNEASARVDVDINIGSPAPVYVVPVPPPPPPPPPRRRIFVEERPRFLYTPSLGFSVSVGSPYDIVYYGNRYYVYDDGGWYRARSYNGPWVFVESHRLPPGIRRFRHDEIRRFRDEEYRRSPKDRGWHDNGRGNGHGHWR